MGRKDRLKMSFEYARSKGFVHTQKDLASLIKASEGNISKALKGDPKVLTDSFLRRFNEAFSNIFSLEWLCLGEGVMIAGDTDAIIKERNQTVIGDSNTATNNNGNHNTINNTTTNNYRGCGGADAKAAKDIAGMGDRVTALETAKPRISYTKGRPYYNVDFIGGFDLVFNDQTINPEYYIDFAPYNKDGVMWCNITGHSMEPQISNGDIIAIKEVQDWFDYLPMGEIYAVVTTNNLRTVKIVRKGSTDDKFRFIPINTKDFDEQEVPKRMIFRVFELLACIKKL